MNICNVTFLVGIIVGCNFLCASGWKMGTLLMIIFVSAIIYIIIAFIVAEIFFRAVIVRRNISPDKDSLYADINSFMHRKFINENKDWLYKQDTQSLNINSFDGLKLHATLLKSKTKSDTTIICFHGYTGNSIDDFSSLARFYYKNDFNVLIVDERAHGKSDGKHIGFGILERHDVISWINHTIKIIGKRSKIFLHGISMGAATVLMAGGLGFSENVKGIIADCGFTSVYEIFSHILKKDYHIPRFPVMYITEIMTRKRAGYAFNDINTVEILKNSKIPTLFIHGELDDFVPLWMSWKNYNACAANKELFIVKGADHAESYYIDRKGYESALQKFMGKYS